MIRIPQTLIADPHCQHADWGAATVVSYRPAEALQSAQVVVTQPTFVLVQAGMKHLHPANASASVTAVAGRVIALRSGTHVMSEFGSGAAGYRSTVLSVDRSFLRDLVGTTPPAIANRCAISEPVDPTLYARFTALCTPDGTGDFALRDVLVRLMAHSQLRGLVFAEVATWGRTPHERLRSVMSEHPYAPLNIGEYADLCAMSVSTFNRRFREAYGAAPGQWLAKTRVQRARELLIGGQHSVQQTGEAVGYPDASTFIRVFKRHVGITPLRFRHQHQPHR